MLRILIPICSFFVITQQPVFDGVVSAEKWQDAQQFSIPYETELSDNGPAHYNTKVFVDGSLGYGEGEVTGNLEIDRVNCILNFNIFF